MGRCKALYAAIRKYGTDSFDWCILATCSTIAEALLEEKRFIEELRPEYNLLPGGKGFAAGYVRSPATIEKWRASRKGWKPTPEQRARAAAARRGIPVSAETREKLSKARRGKSLSPETVAKIAAKNRDLKHSLETRQKMSASRRGKPRGPRSKEWAQKIAAANRGRVMTQEQRERISRGMIGRQFSQETRRKISAARRGKPFSPAHRAALAASWTEARREKQRATWARKQQATQDVVV